MNSTFWQDFFYDLDNLGDRETVARIHSEILIEELNIAIYDIENLDSKNAITGIKKIIDSIEVEE